MFVSDETVPVTSVVPMLHVADVERSARFYRLLGFEIGNRVPEAGRPHWVWLYGPKVPDWRRGPNLMLTQSECPIEADRQQFLLYLYATKLVSLREELISAGWNPGEICYPEYLPKGEFRILDPDGYCLMLAQVDPNTP